MARPKADPTAPSAPKTPQEALDQGLIDISEIAAGNPESPELANCIEKAAEALDEKATVLAKLGSARELASLLIANGSGSQEQAAWVKFYLPRKKRKDAEEDSNGVDGDDE